MIARLIRILIASGLLAFTAVATFAVHAEWPTAVIAMLPVLGVAALLVVYAVEGAWMLLLASTDPDTPRPPVRRVAAALLEEAARALPIFLWHQPRAGGADVEHLDRERHADRTAVLLVHGYLCNAGFWWHWHRRFAERDQPHVAVTLEPPFGSIDDLGRRLDAAIRRLHAVTRRPVVVVAHSMGGLVVRAWWRSHADWAEAHVAHVVTIGTPHHGTVLAASAATANGRQMRPDNPWLAGLASAEPPTRAERFTCVHSNCDNVVFPPCRARMAGARAHFVPNAAHIALSARPEVWHLVDAHVRAAEARAAAGARHPAV